MNKYEELMQQFCPEGVPYKMLGELGTLTRGKRFVHADAVDEGVPCIHYGELYTFYGISTSRARSHIREDLRPKMRYAHKNDVIIVGAGENNTEIGVGVAYIGEEPVAVHDACYTFHHNENPKYISYCLRTTDYHQKLKKYVSEGKICSVSAENIGKMIIPVPPLQIQNEIVAILDNLTKFSTELIDNLILELTERKRQYEYYRNKVLSFDYTMPVLTIRDICKNIVSGGTPKSNVAEYYGGTIPWLRTQEVGWKDIYDTAIHITEEGLRNSSARWIPENCVIVAMYGATAGKVAINKIPLTTNQACCNLEVDSNQALYKYVFYWLGKEYESLKALGKGSQSNINAQTIKQYKIMVPPLDIQLNIVKTLDKMDDIYNQIFEELKSEIDIRQQQYEYYRDKLLTFKELA